MVILIIQQSFRSEKMSRLITNSGDNTKNLSTCQKQQVDQTASYHTYHINAFEWWMIWSLNTRESVVVREQKTHIQSNHQKINDWTWRNITLFDNTYKHAKVPFYEHSLFSRSVGRSFVYSSFSKFFFLIIIILFLGRMQRKRKSCDSFILRPHTA